MCRGVLLCAGTVSDRGVHTPFSSYRHFPARVGEGGGHQVSLGFGVAEGIEGCGFDRTSVDAVASRAEVSKRTVYDYFGDKHTLLRAVVEATAESLLSTVRRTLDETLTDVTAADQLEDALITFSMRIATGMLDSEEYATLQRLVRTEFAEPLHQDNPLADALEEALAERFAALDRTGLLDVADPRLAADHLLALTFGVTLNRLGSANAADDSRVQPLITEGVRTFLRSYRAEQ